MKTDADVDVIVIGGGICGLFLLAALRSAGFCTLLLERRSIGGIQTIASQGIIHGGVKYALSGSASDGAKAIRDMPAAWFSCLSGTGIVDLRAARVLSDHQHLWTDAGALARFTGLAAAQVIRTTVARVDEHDLPESLKPAASAGRAVYRVAEPVLDVGTVIQALIAQHRDWIAAADDVRIEGSPGTHLTFLNGERSLSLGAHQVVLAAGAGNAGLIRQVAAHGHQAPITQDRPLHMVMVKSPVLPKLFGHCVGALTSTPRLTITTGMTEEDEPVWYIGGGLAEAGVQSTPAQLIQQARSECARCMPWSAPWLRDASWRTLRIDRSEGLPQGASPGSRPDVPVIHPINPHVLAVWPTKLAFAPKVAHDIVARISAAALRAGSGHDTPLGLMMPPQAAPPWHSTNIPEASVWQR